MPAGGRTLPAWLPRITIGLLAAALICGLLLPVYTDEIGWRFQERAGFDGVDTLYSQRCGPNTLAVPAFFMWPARWYSAAFNGAFATPLTIRLSGILYSLVWVAMLVALIRRIAPREQVRVLTIIGCALMGLGVMPLLLVWSRPEQPILLAITAALLIAFADRERVGGVWRPFALLACALVALSYHFKALLLVPAFAACMLIAPPRGGVSVRLGALVLLGAGAWLAKSYWFARLACPGDPMLAAEHARQSIGLQAMQGGRGALGLVGALLGNMNPLEYVRLAAPSAHPMSGWLTEEVGSTGQYVWRTALRILWWGTSLLGLCAGAIALARSIRARQAEPRLILGLLLLGAACAWSASQLQRNVYEAVFVLPVLMLAVVLLFAGEGSGRRCLKPLALLLAVAMPVSMTLAAITYAPPLLRAFGQRGYLDAQSHSLAVRGYRDLAPQILAAARQCDIAPGHNDRKLLVDELTYLAFMRSPLPQHYLDITASEAPGAKIDPIAYLQTQGSDGAILGCRHLPPDLQARAKRQGDFCCLRLAGPTGR